MQPMLAIVFSITLIKKQELHSTTITFLPPLNILEDYAAHLGDDVSDAPP